MGRRMGRKLDSLAHEAAQHCRRRIQDPDILGRECSARPAECPWPILGAGLVVDAKIHSMSTSEINKSGQGSGRAKEALGLQRARGAG